MGAIFYTEPFLTFDLDVFVRNGAPNENALRFNNAKPAVTRNGCEATAGLSNRRYKDALRVRGYIEEKNECVLIEGVPVQFLPVYNSLIEEALDQAQDTTYENVPTRIL